MCMCSTDDTVVVLCVQAAQMTVVALCLQAAQMTQLLHLTCDIQEDGHHAHVVLHRRLWNN